MEMIAWDFSASLVPFSQQQRESICYNQTCELTSPATAMSRVTCSPIDDKHAGPGGNWASVYTQAHSSDEPSIQEPKFLSK